MTLKELKEALSESVDTLIEARETRDKSAAAKADAVSAADADQAAYETAVTETRAKIEALNAAL